MFYEEQPITILVVDDDPAILRFLQVFLEEEGYETLTTDKGEEVEALLFSKAPDLVLLDVILPGRNGLEILRQLKENAQYRSIPLILYSASASSRERALFLGANAFLSKPFEIEELLETIELTLAS